MLPVLTPISLLLTLLPIGTIFVLSRVEVRPIMTAFPKVEPIM